MLGTKLYNDLWARLLPLVEDKLRAPEVEMSALPGDGWDQGSAVIGTAKAARAEVGGLSNPSKMPGKAFGLPAAACRTGGKLREVKGSVCENCYAHGRGNYGRTEDVLRAQVRRLQMMPDPHVWSKAWGTWASTFSKALARSEWFRFEDSGDTMGRAHALAVVMVARLRPDVRFWKPTKEHRDWLWVRKMLGDDWPENLTVRVSAPMNGQVMTSPFPTASVDTGVGWSCPAYKQGGECGECRACWESTVENTDYPNH